MTSKRDIKIAEFKEMRVDKEKVAAHVRKYGGGCTRSSLGRIMTREEFEAKKKRILDRTISMQGGIFSD